MLIDEYDHPLLSHITDSSMAGEIQKILKSFYEIIKSLDGCFRAIFVVGITKFAKSSLFSALNNLRDISESPDYATLLGYTEQEIMQYFKQDIVLFAREKGCSVPDILAEMKLWYNGYRFSTKDMRVYNPFSVAYYLIDRKCANYWFSSGTPTFLIERLKKEPFSLYEGRTQ